MQQDWNPPGQQDKLIAFSEPPPAGKENEVFHPWFLKQVARMLEDTAAERSMDILISRREEKKSAERICIGELYHTHNQAVLLNSMPDLSRYRSQARHLLDMVTVIELKRAGNIDDEAILQVCKYGGQLLTAQPHRKFCFVGLSDGHIIRVYEFVLKDSSRPIAIRCQTSSLGEREGQQLLAALLRNSHASLGYVPLDYLREMGVEVGNVLGRGGFSAAFEAKYMDSTCVVKVHREPAQCQLEAHILQQLRGSPCFPQLLDTRSPVTLCSPVGQVATSGNFRKKEFLDQLLDALGALHSQKLVHCDFRPHNILRQNDERPLQSPLLIDFGCCVMEGENMPLLTPTFAAE